MSKNKIQCSKLKSQKFLVTLVTEKHFGEWRQSDQEVENSATVGVMAAIMVGFHSQQGVVRILSTVSLLLQNL